MNKSDEKPGLAAYIGQDGQGHLLIGTLRAKKTQATRTWRLVGWRGNTCKVKFTFGGIGGRQMSKALLLKLPRRFSIAELAPICRMLLEAVAPAPPFVRQMPTALALAAVKEIFPESNPPRPTWLARIVTCDDLTDAARQEIKKAKLKEWIVEGDADVEKFFSELKRMKAKPSAGTVKKARVLFLFSHWQIIACPGMTAPKLYNMAVEKLGASNVGDKEGFRTLLRRLGIRLASPGRPRK